MSKIDYYFDKHMNESVKEAMMMISEASRFISFAEEYAASNGEFEELKNLAAHCDAIKENLKAFLRWGEQTTPIERAVKAYAELCGEEDE